MSKVLATPDEYEGFAPKPGSPVAKAFNDIRVAPTAGYAVLLQVAYPTVGYGVHQYSSFTRDPWGRLLRTLDYVHGTISGGPELAGSIGARVRAMHRTIKGERDDGVRYSAMEPEAFAWVHATLAQAAIEGHRRFATPLTRAQQQELWTQWRDVGRLVGVRYRDLPETIEGFDEYVAEVFATKLAWTPAIPEVMGTPRISGSPHPAVPAFAWKPVALLGAQQFRVLTTGLLPPELRLRLRLPYSGPDAAIFRAHELISRTSAPLIRGPLANFGPYYVRARRRQIERGDVASTAHPPKRRRSSSSSSESLAA
ncbi:MAG: oxygenase MpaB family protein [Solirubrobacteraceae bacterium]